MRINILTADGGWWEADHGEANTHDFFHSFMQGVGFIKAYPYIGEYDGESYKGENPTYIQKSSIIAVEFIGEER